MSFIKKVEPAVQASMETNIDIDVNEGDNITQVDPLDGRTDQVVPAEPPVPVEEYKREPTDVSVMDEIVSLESMYYTIRDYQDSGMHFTESHVPLMINALSSQMPKGQQLADICPSLESDHRLMRTDLNVSMEGVIDKLKAAMKKTKQFFFKPKLSWGEKLKRIEARLESGDVETKEGMSKVKISMTNGSFDFERLLKDSKQAYTNLGAARVNRFLDVIKDFDNEIEKELKIDRDWDSQNAEDSNKILHWVKREAKRVDPTKFFIEFEEGKLDGHWVVPNNTYDTMVYEVESSNGFPHFRLAVTGKEAHAPLLTLDQCKKLFAVIKSGEATMVKDISGTCYFIVYTTCVEGLNQFYFNHEQMTIKLVQLIEESLGL